MVELAVEDVVLPHRDNPSQRISISPPRDEKGEAVPVHVRVLVHKLRKGRVCFISLPVCLSSVKQLPLHLLNRKLMGLVRNT
jgi:hypothetical protein